jgi:tubulin---tyrosine ligase
VDSTPASCVQIGLFHYFKERGPIDLVISGPNYGRNTTAVFALSSGTLGGALEAAVCGVRAVALSYAFLSRQHDAEIIAAASRMGVRVIEAIVKSWDENVHVYSVNVPLVKNVETTKVLWTRMLQNRWKSGSCFTATEVPAEEDDSPEEEEMKIRQAEGSAESNVEGSAEKDSNTSSSSQENHVRYTHKHFKWTPTFTDVYESVENAPPGNDGWAVKEGFVR